MRSKEIAPNLATPPELFSREEQNKLRNTSLVGELPMDLRSEAPDLSWESEQLAKSHGVYLEFNRDQKRDKDWVFMIRFANPGGGPIGRTQWRILDELASVHALDPEGNASLRLTTRQAIQLHWIHKPALVPIVRTLAEAGLRSLNGCGDNTRNVLCCPLLASGDPHGISALAQETANYFQLPVEPFVRVFGIDPEAVPVPLESFAYGPALLNRKLKIAFSAAHRAADGTLVPDNCVELRSNDIGVAPVVVGSDVDGFQIYVGGGQGERQNRPTFAALGEPLARVAREEVLSVLDAIVGVHQQWGDRQNRHWARLKYVVRSMGVDWLRERVAERLGRALPQADPAVAVGPRELHHGWAETPDGQFAHGVFIENGRLTDASPNGRLKSMVRRLMDELPISLMVTPNQDLLFTGIAAEARREFEQLLDHHGYGSRHGRPLSTLRRLSGACVGLPSCRLSYSDSERFEPELVDALEARGWSDVQESIGITGCERQCFRPATKSIGLIATGSDRYQVVLFGDVVGDHQGTRLIAADGRVYLRSVPRAQVVDVIDALLRHHRDQGLAGEGLGAHLRRLGLGGVVTLLQTDPATAELARGSRAPSGAGGPDEDKSK